MSLKEKFQITVPGKDTGNEPWASFESARDTHGEMPYDNKDATQEPDGKFNELPPGMNINGQLSSTLHEEGHMPWAGVDNRNDVTKNDPDFLKKGYSRAQMRGTDDQYTGEHIDLFYGIAYGDTEQEQGFIERNNYLDRE